MTAVTRRANGSCFPLVQEAVGRPLEKRSMVALISLLFLFVFCVGYQYYHFYH